MEICFGKVDITPQPGTYLAGYGVDQPRMATDTNNPLFARCTIYWDSGYPNVVVTADVLGFAKPMHDTIRAGVTALGVGSADFVLMATHTHNGPVLVERLDPYIAYNMTPAQTAVVTAYSDALAQQLIQLVADTLALPRIPCTLDYQVATASFASNREYLPYVERDVPILVARSLTGTPLAVLFGYGCHPVAAGIQTMFDPDYPGGAVTWIESLTGAFAQFTSGAAGDQDPTGTFGWSNRDALGSDLGHAVSNAIATSGRPVQGPILTSYRYISLPLDITDTPTNLAAVRAAYVNRKAAGQPGWFQRHAEEMIKQIDAHSFRTTVPLPLQVWKLSGAQPLRIAFTGGELVSGYAAYFRSRYGGSNGIWIASYANETPAYIPSDELLFTKPGIYYACGWSPDAPGIAGGSMTVYAWLGHFKGRKPGTTVNGVEQLLISNLTAML